MKLIKSKLKIAITGHTGVIGKSFIKKYCCFSRDWTNPWEL